MVKRRGRRPRLWAHPCVEAPRVAKLRFEFSTSLGHRREEYASCVARSVSIALEDETRELAQLRQQRSVSFACNLYASGAGVTHVLNLE